MDSNMNQTTSRQALSDQAQAITSVWASHAAFNRALDTGLGTIHGIGLTEYMVLLHLNNAPDKSLRRIDLAESVSRTASGVTRMLLPMEKIGLVKRDTNPRDARVSLVKITRSGEKIFKDATVTLNQKCEHLLRRLEDKQVAQLIEILSQATDR